MPLTLTPLEPSKGRQPRTPLEEIDSDVKDAVEDAYTYGVDNPMVRLSAKVGKTRDDADNWLREARAYAFQREAGRVQVVGNSTKTGEVRFYVSGYSET